jgi:GGDEF domain-containing protein
VVTLLLLVVFGMGGFRKNDLIGRLGGDEFAVTAVDIAPHSLAQFEQRLEKTLQQSNQKTDRTFQLSLSVGFSSAMTR